MKNNRILITGTAGFIGMHVALKLLKNKKNKILGIDNINNYYDQKLKIQRNKILKKSKNYFFKKIDLKNKKKLFNELLKFKPNYIIHLAAQAGVRYAFKNPHAYNKSNIDGFLNILEYCKNYKVKHLVTASSSSVYGLNEEIPFHEEQEINKTFSYYSVTKRANELMAFNYSYNFSIPTTAIRFFTVYGPWGRPDMAYYIFARAIIDGEKVNLHKKGKMLRDFTYIDDATKALIKILNIIPKKNIKNNKKFKQKKNSIAPFEIINVGNSTPERVDTLIKYLEKELSGKLNYKNINKQKGELDVTYASTKKLKKYVNFAPKTKLKDGVRKFSEWFKEYHSLNEKK